MKVLFTPNNAGFFSNFNKIILHIWIFKVRNILSDAEFYVKWYDKSCFLYGGEKLWSSLFTSLQTITDDESSYDLVIENFFHKEETKFIAANTHSILIDNDQSWRNDLHSLYTTYIQINSSFQQEVDDYYNINFKGYHIISVHIRSGAHACEQYRNIMPSRHIYIQMINKYISTLSEPYKIYLATDIKEGLHDFKNAYGNNLIYLEQDLYKDGEQEDALESSLLKGNNIMKDALLLSKGNILFHSISNVTLAVLYINPTIKNIYIHA